MMFRIQKMNGVSARYVKSDNGFQTATIAARPLAGSW
jgi:hypothetical protein